MLLGFRFFVLFFFSSISWLRLRTPVAPDHFCVKQAMSSSAVAGTAKSESKGGISAVDSHISFPNAERDVLAYWDEIKAFETSLKLSEGRPAYTFYDGPPFATGLPHYGHLLAGTIKDVVTRYAHQTGHYVSRRFGWGN